MYLLHLLLHNKNEVKLTKIFASRPIHTCHNSNYSWSIRMMTKGVHIIFEITLAILMTDPE